VQQIQVAPNITSHKRSMAHLSKEIKKYAKIEDDERRKTWKRKDTC